MMRNLLTPLPSGLLMLGDPRVGVLPSEIPSTGLLAYYSGVGSSALYNAVITAAGDTGELDTFESGLPSSGWVSLGSRTTVKNLGINAQSGIYALSLIQGNDQQDQVFRFDTDPLTPVYVEFFLRANIANPPRGVQNWVQLLFRAYDGASTPLGTITSVGYINQEDVPTSWTSFKDTMTVVGGGVPFIAPVGTAYVLVTVRLQPAVGYSGEIWLDDFSVSNSSQSYPYVGVDGEVISTPGTIIYDVYENGDVIQQDLVFGGGWATGGQPIIISRTSTTFTLTGQTAALGSVSAIGQRPGLSPPSYSQVVDGKDSEDNDAPMVGEVAVADFTQPFTLTMTRVLGDTHPIFDVYVAVSSEDPVVGYSSELLAPPAGKGYVVVGGLPAPTGSMLLQLPITVVDGDVIEYDLNSRPSASVVTIQPNGVRSAG